MKTKIFYHISEYNLGKQVILKPRIPENRHSSFYEHPYIKDNCDPYGETAKLFEEDDKIKRICVSTSISGAMRARADETYCSIDYFVYKAIDPYAVSRDLPLLLVPDAHETDEHWLLTKTKFQKIGQIRGNDTWWKWIYRL